MWMYLVFAALCITLLYKLQRKFVSSFVETKDKYIFVTGCDSGFGRRTAIKLNKLGSHVIAGCYTQRGADDLHKICSDRMTTVMLDVTKSDDIENAIKIVEDVLPDGTGLWGLVNNAGISGNGLIEWVPIDRYKHVVEVNLFGVVAVTKAFLQHLKNSHGRVVNISSILGRVSTVGSSAYSISKYGLLAFSDALRLEMKHFDVSVHVVEPGSFRTNMICGGALRRELLELYNKLDNTSRQIYTKQYLKEMQEDIDNYVQRASTDFDLVTNTIAEALFARNPRSYYLIGFGTKFMAFIALLPTFISDFLLSKFFSIPLPKKSA